MFFQQPQQAMEQLAIPANSLVTNLALHLRLTVKYLGLLIEPAASFFINVRATRAFFGASVQQPVEIILDHQEQALHPNNGLGSPRDGSMYRAG
jgi:hypothetical protein